MQPRITVITLGVDDLERAVKFYRDGLGLQTEGVVGTEFAYGDGASGAGRGADCQAGPGDLLGRLCRLLSRPRPASLGSRLEPAVVAPRVERASQLAHQAAGLATTAGLTHEPRPLGSPRHRGDRSQRRSAVHAETEATYGARSA